MTDQRSAALRREAFTVNEVRVGDVIRYPAILRPEHREVRSRRLVVVEITAGGYLRCLSKTDDGVKQKSSVYPTQLIENGVLVEDHVGD